MKGRRIQAGSFLDSPYRKINHCVDDLIIAYYLINSTIGSCDFDYLYICHSLSLIYRLHNLKMNNWIYMRTNDNFTTSWLYRKLDGSQIELLLPYLQILFHFISLQYRKFNFFNQGGFLSSVGAWCLCGALGRLQGFYAGISLTDSH